MITDLPLLSFAVPVVIIFCRELFVSALREWMATQGLRDAVKVKNLGKWKTAFQMISTCFLLIFVTDLDGNADLNLVKLLGISGEDIGALAITTLHISTILTVLSGFDYVKAAKTALDDRYISFRNQKERFTES